MALAAEIDRYADVLVRAGVNLEAGQRLLVIGLIEHAQMVRALVDAGYRAGAEHVAVEYDDRHPVRSQALHAPDGAVAVMPGWHRHMTDEVIEHRWASVIVVGDELESPFAGADPDRLARLLAPRQADAFRVMEARMPWTVCAFPVPGWSERLYGRADVERLWQELRVMMRMDADDPVEAWRAHLDELDRRAAALNRLAAVAIRFTGPDTDLRVGVNALAEWNSARFRTAWDTSFIPNLPTEEIFTVPDFRNAEGRVRCTKPVRINGQRVEGLRLRFENGSIVDVEADLNAEVVRAQIATDEGARRLGEVALVDRASRIGSFGRLYDEVLLDENVTCHIAWGAAIVEALDSSPDEGEQHALGINRSAVHTDVMIGGPEVTVIAESADGAETPVIVEDTWQL